jgi:UDP-N-acetylmuramate--alanine ligase
MIIKQRMINSAHRNTDISKIRYVYFIGIGGIGMSALAHYFIQHGYFVAGYDRSRSSVTSSLEAAGASVVYSPSADCVPPLFAQADVSEILVVATPAVPLTHPQLRMFSAGGYKILKRAEVLGLLTISKKCAAIAGTHGKTSVTTCLSHILRQSELGCSAFLGGISKNYGTNFFADTSSDWVAVEADEYDRSFLTLYPQVAVITYIDADHLEIYGSIEAIRKSFEAFVSNIQPGGVLIYKLGLPLEAALADLASRGARYYTYSLDGSGADFWIDGLRIEDNRYRGYINAPCGGRYSCWFGQPGRHNAENALAAFAAAYCAGAAPESIVKSIATFQGVKRRFDLIFKEGGCAYYDDYAHHPEEIAATVRSLKELYAGQKVAGVFQPHLFSRTRDFAAEFASSLSLLDSVFLLDIYPAREEPIEGVSSYSIASEIHGVPCHVCSPLELRNSLLQADFQVLVSMGAGDIDMLTGMLAEVVQIKARS